MQSRVNKMVTERTGTCFTGPLVAAVPPADALLLHAFGRFRGRFGLKTIKTATEVMTLNY